MRTRAPKAGRLDENVSTREIFRGAADCRWFCGLFCCIYLVFCLFLASSSRPPSPSSSLHIFQLLPIFLPPYPHVLSIPLLQDTEWLELPCSSLHFPLNFRRKSGAKSGSSGNKIKNSDERNICIYFLNHVDFRLANSEKNSVRENPR